MNLEAWWNWFIWSNELNAINTVAWVTSNLLVAYISMVLVIFVVGYFILFDPKATTAGKFIFRFFLSLFWIVGLVFVGIFVDPKVGREWFVYPGDVLFWRPLARLIGYGYIAYTITGLAILLGVRKWKPSLLRTSLDRDIVKPRKSL